MSNVTKFNNRIILMVIIEKIELNTGAAMPRASGLCGAFDWSDADRPDAFHRQGITAYAPGVNPALARRQPVLCQRRYR